MAAIAGLISSANWSVAGERGHSTANERQLDEIARAWKQAGATMAWERENEVIGYRSINEGIGYQVFQEDQSRPGDLLVFQFWTWPVPTAACFMISEPRHPSVTSPPKPRFDRSS
jgi:hypothetical protein